MQDKQIDFYNDDLDFTGGYNMSIDGGRLYRGNVMATQTSILDFTNDAYFYNSTLDLGTLDGACRIYGTCSFGSIIMIGCMIYPFEVNYAVEKVLIRTAGVMPFTKRA